MTEYVVLYKKDSESGWRDPLLPAHPREARSALAAITQVAAGYQDAQEYEWVAVPARSWLPVSVKVETKTSLKFS